MQKISEFKLKDGRVIDLVLPSMDLLHPYTDFINRLSQEDTFLYLAGEHYSYDAQRNWLENSLREIEYKKHYFIWAFYQGKIIGNCDVRRGGAREKHVGTIGLFVDKDFRGQGLGKFLANFIIDQSKKMDYKILRIEVFSDNEIAIEMYKKLGFEIYGSLPNGLMRRGKYSDKIEMMKELN